MSKVTKKVFITKYATTKGVIEMEVEISETYPEIASHGYTYFHKRDWYENKLDALMNAKTRINKKLESLVRQKTKLEKKLKKLDEEHNQEVRLETIKY